MFLEFGNNNSVFFIFKFFMYLQSICGIGYFKDIILTQRNIFRLLGVKIKII